MVRAKIKTNTVRIVGDIKLQEYTNGSWAMWNGAGWRNQPSELCRKLWDQHQEIQKLRAELEKLKNTGQ